LLAVERRDHRAGGRDVVELPDKGIVAVCEAGGDRLRELPFPPRARFDSRRETRGEERQRPIAPPLQPCGARERFALHADGASGLPTLL
jgi:hypothetical protein